MALYETVVIARQELAQNQVEALTETCQNLVTQNGGTVAKTESWGLRTLAYKIRKNRKGHYVMFHFDAPPAAMQETERNMRLNEDILRYLTIRVDEFEAGPSAIIRAKEAGDEGERGSYGDRDRGGDRGYRPRYNKTNDNEAVSEGVEA